MTRLTDAARACVYWLALAALAVVGLLAAVWDGLSGERDRGE